MSSSRRYFHLALVLFALVLVPFRASADVPNPDNWGHQPPDSRAYPLGDGARIWLVPDGMTMNSPDSGYVLDVTFQKGYGFTYEQAPHNFSVYVGAVTGPEDVEMGQFHASHMARTDRTYDDGAIVLAIGNNWPGSGGAEMGYDSHANDGGDPHRGKVAIINVCDKQYIFEVWGTGEDGAWGEGFGAIVHQTEFSPCSSPSPTDTTTPSLSNNVPLAGMGMSINPAGGWHLGKTEVMNPKWLSLFMQDSRLNPMIINRKIGAMDGDSEAAWYREQQLTLGSNVRTMLTPVISDGISGHIGSYSYQGIETAGNVSGSSNTPFMAQRVYTLYVARAGDDLISVEFICGAINAKASCPDPSPTILSIAVTGPATQVTR